MIMPQDEKLGPLSIVVVDIGNTSTRCARWVEGNIEDLAQVATEKSTQVVEMLTQVRNQCENRNRQAIVIASVVPESTGLLTDHIEHELNLRPFVIGDNTPLPVETSLPDADRIGVDRLCNAAAAFSRTQQACVVIDVGSAVTVDLVDDQGVFQGGAIFPGLRMQARSLSEMSAQLPHIEPAAVISPLGKSTADAIAGGLFFGMAGAIRGIVEQIATGTQAWPQTVLTGGDAALLKDHLDFVDSWVPDLCLMGVGLAFMRRVEDSTQAS